MLRKVLIALLGAGFVCSVQAAYNEPANGANVTNGGAISVTATGGSTARTLANHLADRISILDFPGCDPTGVADSTACIQAAIDFSYNSHTGAHPTIYVPVGTYSVTKLHGRAYVHVEGSNEGTGHSRLAWAGLGWGSQFVQISGTNDDIVYYDTSSTPVGDGTVADTGFTNIQFRGQWTGPGDVTNTAGNGINFIGVYAIQDCRFENLTFHNIAGDAIRSNIIPLPGYFRNVWASYLGGSVLDLIYPTNRGTQIVSADMIQGDFIVGSVITVDGTLRTGAGGNMAGEVYNFTHLKHEIDSSATSQTAYGPNTITLKNLDRAVVNVDGVDAQPSNPLSGPGLPVTNSIVQLTGTTTPYLYVRGSRMASALATTDYLIDDQVNGIQVPKTARQSVYLAPQQNFVTSIAGTDVITSSRVRSDTTGVFDANVRFSRDVNGLMSWGAGSGATDVSLGRNSAGFIGIAGGLTLTTSYQIGGANAINYPTGDTTTGGSIAIGTSALSTETAAGSAAFHNTAVGYQASGNGTLTTAATDNTVVGYQAGAALTSSHNNTMIGSGAGAATTSSNNVTAIGKAAVASAGSSNTVGVGVNALTSTTAAANSGVGFQAGQFVSSGAHNTAIGATAMQGITGTRITGSNNTAVGDASLLLCQGACASDTAVGQNAAAALTTGTSNTAIGASVGSATLTTASNVLLVGTSSNTDSNTSNSIHIGAGAADIISATGTDVPSTSATTIAGSLNAAGALTTATHPVVYELCQGSAASPTTHTGDTSETNLAVCSVPANTIGAHGALRITALWSRSATSTNTVTYVVRMNASSGAVTGGTAIVNVANSSSGSTDAQSVTIMRNTATNAQQILFGGAFTYTGTGVAAPSTGAQDTTAQQYLNFNCTDTTSSSDTCGLYSYTVEVIP